jgi:hypothetical protein
MANQATASKASQGELSPAQQFVRAINSDWILCQAFRLKMIESLGDTYANGDVVTSWLEQLGFVPTLDEVGAALDAYPSRDLAYWDGIYVMTSDEGEEQVPHALVITDGVPHLDGVPLGESATYEARVLTFTGIAGDDQTASDANQYSGVLTFGFGEQTDIAGAIEAGDLTKTCVGRLWRPPAEEPKSDNARSTVPQDGLLFRAGDPENAPSSESSAAPGPMLGGGFLRGFLMVLGMIGTFVIIKKYKQFREAVRLGNEARQRLENGAEDAEADKKAEEATTDAESQLKDVFRDEPVLREAIHDEKLPVSSQEVHAAATVARSNLGDLIQVQKQKIEIRTKATEAYTWAHAVHRNLTEAMFAARAKYKDKPSNATAQAYNRAIEREKDAREERDRTFEEFVDSLNDAHRAECEVKRVERLERMPH